MAVSVLLGVFVGVQIGGFAVVFLFIVRLLCGLARLSFCFI